MTEPPRCPKCGIPLPADAPAGLCPKCLVQAGLESEPRPQPKPAATVPSPAFAGFEPLSVASLAGKFPQLEILELLGKGGMGAVYKARQRGLDRLVAVKVLPPEIGHDPAFAERFTREARALARLSHNHIVSVFDFGQADGLFYIVMEYVDGVNLRQTIQTGKLTPAEALAIVPQICEALQFAHDEGIVHRDIKPENILIDKRGRVKIADFGLAKLLGQDASDHLLTATHQVMGTLRYMAPEQMQGSREVDHRADIYSLGVIFYELLTGELPMGKFAPPSKKVQIDVRLDEVVLRALEQHPEQRYQHASELKTELDSIRTSAPAPHPAELKDPLDAFRSLSRFAMTPQPGYGKQVALPMVVLFLLWVAATITAHVFYGQKENYREGPILLVQGGGMLLYVVIIFVLNLRFVVRKRTVQSSSVPAFLSPVEPRFSRFAILGAVWALFGLLAVIPTLFFIALNRVWNGTALPTDLVHEQPPLPFLIFMVLLLAVGSGAPIGTTICGALAIGHIKRSGGRIIGLPLAVADAIFFPLLVLAGIIAVLTSQIWVGLAPHPNAAAIGAGAAFGILVALVVCFFVARAVWRAIAGRPAQPETPESSKENQPGMVKAANGPRLSRCALTGAIWAPLFFVAPIVLFLLQNRSYAPGEYTGPSWWQRLLMFTVLPLGPLAPFGTTILGAIAISQIKRAGGKLYGVRLAQGDALFFPLLLLAAAAGLAGTIILLGPLQLSGLDQRIFTTPLQEVLMFLIAVPIWFFPARALWRAVVGPRDAFAIPRIPLVGTEALVGQAALVLGLAAIAAHAWPWHWIIMPNNHSVAISNFDDIRAMQSLLALALAIAAALFAAAPSLTLPVKRIMRGGAVIGALVALVMQIQFFRSLGEWEPGHVGTVVRLTRSYPQMGLYAALALTALTILFFVLRLFEEKMEQRNSPAGTES